MHDSVFQPGLVLVVFLCFCNFYDNKLTVLFLVLVNCSNPDFSIVVFGIDSARILPCVIIYQELKLNSSHSSEGQLSLSLNHMYHVVIQGRSRRCQRRLTSSSRWWTSSKTTAGRPKSWGRMSIRSGCPSTPPSKQLSESTS